MKRVLVSIVVLLLICLLSYSSKSTTDGNTYNPPLSYAIRVLEKETANVNASPKEELTLRRYFEALFKK